MQNFYKQEQPLAVCHRKILIYKTFPFGAIWVRRFVIRLLLLKGQRLSLSTIHKLSFGWRHFSRAIKNSYKFLKRGEMCIRLLPLKFSMCRLNLLMLKCDDGQRSLTSVFSTAWG